MKIAAIIPSGSSHRAESLRLLLEDIQKQTLRPQQIEVVHGVFPSGLARNLGASRCEADIYIFIDDDVRLGAPDLFENMCDCLAQPEIGMVGAAQLIPQDSSAFQVRCARQIPRSQSDIVNEVTESDMVTTACCAVRSADFNKLKGFHENLPRGVDPEFRQRIRAIGQRVCVAPHAWYYHPMPKTWSDLLLMAYRNGASSAYVQRLYPDLVFYNPEGHVSSFEARPSFGQRLLWRIARWSKALSRGSFALVAYDLAYIAGLLRQRYSKDFLARG